MVIGFDRSEDMILQFQAGTVGLDEEITFVSMVVSEVKFDFSL